MIKDGVVAGLIASKVAYTPLEEAVSALRPIDKRLHELAHLMEI